MSKDDGLRSRAAIQRAPAWVMVLVGWVAACDGDAPNLAPTAGRCAGLSHQWLSADQVGQPLQWDEGLLSPLSASQLASIAAAAGTVIPPALRTAPYGARLFSMRYTTQDRGRPVKASGMVALPWREEGLDGDFPVVLFLHGTTGLTGACAPSTLGLEYSGPLYLLAAQGFIVVAPDYIGLDPEATEDDQPVRHAYLHIEQAGIGSLDQLRATLAVLAEHRDDVMVRASDDVVLWGGSQGGHAAFAVDLMAPLYAPEFKIRGSVAIVPPTDLVGLGNYALAGVNSATPVLAVAMVTHHLWYGGQAHWTDLLTDVEPTFLASRLPEELFSTCDADDIVPEKLTAGEIYAADFLSGVEEHGLTATIPWGCYAAENSFSTTSIPRVNATPTFFIVGESDDLVDTASERADFDRLCEKGYSLEYLECAQASHTEAVAWSITEQLAWVRQRLAGQAIDQAKRCQREPPVRCSGQPPDE